MDRAGARALLQGARQIWIKAGDEILRLDSASSPGAADEAMRHLVHADGLLRVPVLVQGDLVVRGYTEALYREALGPAGG